uniref:Leucine-rich repeat transmembrane protein kinase n=1 Tax=Rhizophora mucronata TaxID=61149 RepID=A0A2P2M566_RHIMU
MLCVSCTFAVHSLQSLLKNGWCKRFHFC